MGSFSSKNTNTTCKVVTGFRTVTLLLAQVAFANTSSKVMPKPKPQTIQLLMNLANPPMLGARRDVKHLVPCELNQLQHDLQIGEGLRVEGLGFGMFPLTLTDSP